MRKPEALKFLQKVLLKWPTELNVPTMYQPTGWIWVYVGHRKECLLRATDAPEGQTPYTIVEKEWKWAETKPEVSNAPVGRHDALRWVVENLACWPNNLMQDAPEGWTWSTTPIESSRGYVLYSTIPNNSESSIITENNWLTERGRLASLANDYKQEPKQMEMLTENDLPKEPIAIVTINLGFNYIPGGMMVFFEHEHLPDDIKEIVEPIAILAAAFDDKLPHCAEKTIGLRKLLEAKDAFIRIAWKLRQ